MPDEIAFLRTILEYPDDDGPRLVYADWLEETGETPRAEFIRVQLELSHLREGDPHRAALAERERKLIGRYGRRWLKRVGGFIRDAEFRRGMLDFVRVTGADFVRHGSRLFERAAVTRVRLTDADEEVPRIAKSSALRWLRSLDIGYNGLSPYHLSLLTQSPHVANLRSLDLSANRLGEVGVLAIIESLHLTGLQELNLARNGISAGILGFLGQGAPPSLTRLTLDGNRMGTGGMTMFADTDLADRLAALSLHGNSLGDADAVALAESPRLVHLTELNLSANAIGDDGAVALAQAPTLAALEILDLSYNQIGPRGAMALAQSQHLDDVRQLALAGNRVGRTAAAVLRRRFGGRVHGLPTDV